MSQKFEIIKKKKTLNNIKKAKQRKWNFNILSHKIKIELVAFKIHCLEKKWVKKQIPFNTQAQVFISGKVNISISDLFFYTFVFSINKTLLFIFITNVLVPNMNN